MACLALAGTAEARLGETFDEIQKRLGDKKLVPQEETRYPNDVIKFKVENARKETGGFDFVRYSFFKNRNTKTEKCIVVNYHKIYDTLEEAPLLKNSESIVAENFRQPISSWGLIKSDGFNENKNISEEYIEWYGPKGESAFACIEKRPIDGKYSLTIFCISEEYADFVQTKNYEKKSLLGKLLHFPSDKTLINIYSNAISGKISKRYYLFEIGIFILSTGIILGGWLFALGLKIKAKWLKIFALLYFVCGLLATTLIVKNLFVWLGLLIELLKTNLG